MRRGWWIPKALAAALSLLFLVESRTVAAQALSMVKDINTIQDGSFGLQAQSIVAVGGSVFLSGTAEGLGVELWKSDGSSAGTVLIKDIWPGPGSSNPTNLVVMGGVVYFFADDGVHGPELWRSDGTEAGTILVKDVQPGSSGSAPRNNMIVVGSTLFFTAYSAGSGEELWKSDGTTAGTALVKDICAGEACSGNPWYLTAIGGTVYFNAVESTYGGELWKSDGTAAGTVLVKDICPGAACSGNPSFLTVSGGTLYFTASDGTNGTELWKSDGTAAGTAMVKDICSGSCVSGPQNLLDVSGTLFFTAYDGTGGAKLWTSDGTSAGTVMVKDFCAGACLSSPGSFTRVGGTLFFRAYDVANGTELWKSDGTTAGTVLVKDICPGGGCNGSPQSLVEMNGTLYFTASDGTTGGELWKSDGTASGTVVVKDICPGSCGSGPSLPTNASGTLFFKAGGELWKSDGTDAGTVVVREFTSPSSFPSSFVEMGGVLYFVASDGTSNRELFRSDGTGAGTSIVLDIGPAGGQGVQGGMTRMGTTLYFNGNDATHGSELWKSDGTAAGTVLVKDAGPGGYGVNPTRLTPVGSTLFFAASDPNGTELWKSDGTDAGTALVKDICPGATCGGNPQNLVDVNGVLFFMATDNVNGTELWKSDGTSAGTGMVKDICLGGCSSNPAALVNVNGTLFFRASDPMNGWELWKSDGTSAGTVMVKDICPGSCSSYPDSMTVLNGTLFFTAWGPDREVWKSDGTAAGTVLVKDICPGSCEASPAGLVAAANRIYFKADDGAHGMELWTSDGTAAGTRLVADVNPGIASSIPRPIRAVGSGLLFAANDGTSGEELWKTDGTAAGTFRVQDLNPGAGHANIGEAMPVGTRVLVAADDGTHGQELWAMAETDLAVTMNASPDPVLQGGTLTYGLTVTNGGTVTATNVRVTAVLPAGATFASSTPGTPTCVNAAGTVTCAVGTLAPAATWNLTIQATVNAGVVGPIAGSASVSANEPDPNGANDTAAASVTVLGPAPPRYLFATALSSTAVALSWVDPLSTQTGIRIDRSTDGTTWTPVTTVPAHDTSTTASSLSPGTLYFFRAVSVQSGIGESIPSNLAVARTFPAVGAKVCATRVGPTHQWNRFPAVAWNGTQWGSVKQTRQPGRELDDIVFQLLDSATGHPVGSPRNLSDDDMPSQAPTIRWNGTRFGVVWSSGMRGPGGKNTSTVNFALLDGAGNKVRGNVRVTANDGHSIPINSNQETAMTWTGSEWGLVLPVTDVAGYYDLWLYRLSPGGDPVGVPVRLTAAAEDEYEPTVAWNGTEYGVAWIWSGTTSRVYFQRFQADGTPIGAPTLVHESAAGESSWSPSMVWDGTDWAVAWNEIGSDPEWIELARLHADGTPDGAPVRVSHDFDPDFPPGDMSIYDELPFLFAKPGGGYVLFTSSYLNTSNAYEIARYETDGGGNRVGLRTVLSDDDGSYSLYQRAAFDGSRYLVVYNDAGEHTLEIAEFIAGASGAAIAGPDVISSGGSPGAWAGTISSGSPLALTLGDGFAVLWSEPTAGTSQIFASVFDGSGSLTASRSPLFTRTFRARPGGVSVGSTFALAWKDNPTNVVFDRYDAAGNSLLGEVVIATGQAGRPGVALAFDGEAYGVAWFTGSSLCFQRVSGVGAPVGGRTTLALAAQPANASPQMAWTPSGWAIVYIRGTELEYVLLDPAGAMSVGPTVLTSSGAFKSVFSIAFSGQKLGLAWAENLGVVPPATDLFFTSVGLNGVKDFSPVNVVSSPWNDGNPSLYWDQDRFRLVHTYGQMAVLREIAILPDGSVAPGERFLSSRGGANSVAFNGTTLGVAWVQYGLLYFETTACTSDATPPSCPVGSASLAGTVATLSWTPASDADSGVQTYSVYRDGTMLAQVLPPATTFVDGGFPPGVTHPYEVRAMNGANLESAGCAPFSPSTDLSITMSDGQVTAVPGTPISYTIVVTNAGPSTVTSVTLTDPVPAAVLSPLFTPGTGTYSSGTGAWTGLSLGPGQSATLTLSGSVDPLARGSLVNMATVATTAGVVDPNPANDSTTDSDTLTPRTDLSIGMTDGPDPVLQGATLTYALTVANAGPSAATGVVLTDTLPPGVTFVSSTPSSPTCTQSAGTVTCNLANMASGSTTPVTIRVTPNAGTVGTITNSATVAAPEFDTNSANNSASVQTTVPGPSLPARSLFVTSRTATSISLKWTDPQGTETGFRVERSTNGTSWSSVTIVGADATTFADTGLLPGTLYYYRVVAIRNLGAEIGEASPSNVAAETTLSTVAAKVCATQLSVDGKTIGKPSVARGASEWAMAWHERPAGEKSTHVYFQRVDDATGALVGSKVLVSSSTGTSSGPTLRWNGSGYGVVYFESLKRPDGQSATEVRYASLDAAGARLRADVGVLPPGRSHVVGARAELPLVWNGSGWGLVTAEATTPPTDLAFYRFDVTGAPVGSRVQLTSTPEWELSPSAAWNGTEYGLAWVRFGTSGGSFQVYFQRMSSSGALLGTPTLLFSNSATWITGTPAWATSVLWDGASWVVAFNDFGSDAAENPEPVYLRRLNPDGTAAGAAVRLSHDFDPDFPLDEQVPIYDESPLLFLRPGGGYRVFTTSYVNTTGQYEVATYRADASLNRVGSRTVLSTTDPFASSGERVATDGSRFLVAYDEGKLGPKMADLVFGEAGTLAGPTELTSDQPSGSGRASPLALALGDGFAALWTYNGSGTNQLQAVLYDGAGNLVASRTPLSSRSVRGRPGAVAVGSNFALAWKDAANALVFCRYDATGSPLIPEATVVPNAGGATTPGLAWSGEVYGLAYAQSSSLYFQRVAADGSPVGPRTTVVTGSVSGQVQLQWAGTGWAVVWLGSSLVSSDLQFAFLDPAGNIVTPPIQVTFTPQLENGVQLLWNGQVLGLTWYDYRYPDPPGGEIFFTVLGLDGIKNFSPVAVVGTSYDDAYPSLYWDVDRFRLVHFAGAPGTLREVAIFPNGTMAAGERMLAPRGGANSVAWNGATLGITWMQLGEVYFETTACLADATPPPCPATTVTGDGSSATVAFTPVTDPESGIWRYDVYRDGAMVAELFPWATSYVDTGMTPGFAHTYQVRALNGAYLESSGCAAVPICPSAPSATNDGPVCEGGTLQLSAGYVPGGIYAWTGPNNFTSSQQLPTISPASPGASGTYSVTVTVNGCTSPASTTTAVVNAKPATPAITAPGSVPANGAGVTASVASHAGATYLWGITNGTITAGGTSNQVTFTAGPAGPVVLTVVETNASGCASGQATVSIPVTTAATLYYPSTPCRLFDTRNVSGPDAASPILAAGETRMLTIGGRCSVPADAKSISVNVTVTTQTVAGELLLYRGDLLAEPTATSISFRSGITRANNGILELARDGSGTLKVTNHASGTVHFILDVNGCFR